MPSIASAPDRTPVNRRCLAGTASPCDTGAGRRYNRQAMRCTRRRLVLVGLLTPLLTGGSLVAATWDTFPGAWVKNRLNLSTNKLERAQQRRDALLEKLGLERAPREVAVTVKKADRRLVLFGDAKEIFSCPVGLGGSPQGPKERQGDQRTPEGRYRVCTRNASSQFHLFLGLDYPNERDADRGLAAGLVSRAQHRQIVRAARAGRQPPWGTALGGAVGIHGSGSSADWTWGCIALDDSDIELLWALCPVGTPVTIEP
jgi:murein L,D-transpeptidase YafK